MDKAHNETDKILANIENDLTAMYKRINKKIQHKISRIIDNLYLDYDERATPIQRLKYAKMNGKDKLIKKYVDIIISANEQAVRKINQSHGEIYKINFILAADMLIEQLQYED